MKHEIAAAVVAAGLVLAQLGALGSYNLGVPTIPGTRTPESNPATAIVPSPSAAPSNAGVSAAVGSPAAMPSASSGPAYSFGAAPSPVIGPSR